VNALAVFVVTVLVVISVGSLALAVVAFLASLKDP
jgi:hypothetical protein